MEEAREKSNHMVDEYTAALEKMFEEHQETRKRQEELEIKTETERIIRENNQRFSVEQIKIKQALGHKHTELKDKLFVEVRDMLARFSETPAYQSLLIKELKEAVAFARGEEITLYIDPSDAERVTSLQVEVGAPITVSSYPFLGGMRAVLPKRNILIDNSFETKLAEAKESFQLRGGASHE
jgi:vacuolar-type H+-ATPase subunit E/Vma4